MATYNAKGGRPRLNVDLNAITADVKAVLGGSGETITSVAARYRVSRSWIHKNIYPALGYVPDRQTAVKDHIRDSGAS